MLTVDLDTTNFDAAWDPEETPHVFEVSRTRATLGVAFAFGKP